MSGVGSNGREYGWWSRPADYRHTVEIEPEFRGEQSAGGELRRKRHWKRSAILDAFHQFYGEALRRQGYEVHVKDVVAYEEVMPLSYGVEYTLKRDHTPLEGVFLALIVHKRSETGLSYLSSPHRVSLRV